MPLLCVQVFADEGVAYWRGKPDAGLGLQVKTRAICQGVPYSLGSGRGLGQNYAPTCLSGDGLLEEKVTRAVLVSFSVAHLNVFGRCGETLSHGGTL